MKSIALDDFGEIIPEARKHIRTAAWRDSMDRGIRVENAEILRPVAAAQVGRPAPGRHTQSPGRPAPRPARPSAVAPAPARGRPSG